MGSSVGFSSKVAPADAFEPERRLAELAHAAAPLRRVVVALAGRLVERGAWDGIGYARLGDYARERLGVSARSLQEFARVDRALAALPALESALALGRLPWSKVRMLARFATRSDEERWIALAEGASVRQLERMCRAVDRGALEAGAAEVDEEGRETEASEWVRLGAPAPLAFKWRRTIEAAAKVSGERVSPGEALEWVTAEALSALPVERCSGEEASSPGESQGVAHADPDEVHSRDRHCSVADPRAVASGASPSLEADPDDVCETSYADKRGKYQAQRGVTLPKA